jgi:FAD/FMN-containing dehydrogenase
MLHLAVGDSPWGVAKARLLSTKLRQAKGEGNLGFINKLVYRNQTAKYQKAMEDAIAAGDTRAAQKVMAQAILESKVVSKLDAEGAELLKEIAEFGYLDDTLALLLKVEERSTWWKTSISMLLKMYLSLARWVLLKSMAKDSNKPQA